MVTVCAITNKISCKADQNVFRFRSLTTCDIFTVRAGPHAAAPLCVCSFRPPPVCLGGEPLLGVHVYHWYGIHFVIASPLGCDCKMNANTCLFQLVCWIVRFELCKKTRGDCQEAGDTTRSASQISNSSAPASAAQKQRLILRYVSYH